jgi:lipopolysaccharide export system protein LptA
MEDDHVSDASFFGNVGFESRGLDAAGASVAYSPVRGSILITGTDAGGAPKVRDERVTIEAARIEVEIESRNMRATGAVKTLLQPAPSAGRASSARGDGSSGSRLPGLFEQGRAASGTAERFEYGGDAGRATYLGNATLWQGDTTVRGDTIVLDQGTGDLTVTGAARSSLVLASGVSASRSASLAYADRDRTITYDGGGGGTAQVTGPDGDLRANRVVVHLELSGNRVARLEARTAVTLKLDTRTATGERLDYLAQDERYVMTGSARTPVKIVEACRETTGGTLTFYKSADRVVIDGNEAARTQSVRGQGCSEPAGR